MGTPLTSVRVLKIRDNRKEKCALSITECAVILEGYHRNERARHQNHRHKRKEKCALSTTECVAILEGHPLNERARHRNHGDKRKEKCAGLKQNV